MVETNLAQVISNFRLPTSDFPGPVVQRLRRLSYKQKKMVRFHPGLLSL